MPRKKKSNKTRLNIEAFNLWKEIVLLKANGLCEVCSRQAITGHHFFPQSTHSHLKYNTDNGVSICMGCHFTHHTKGDPIIHLTVQEKRGKRWLNKLLGIPRPVGTYITEAWIKENIIRLHKELNEEINKRDKANCQ